MPSACARRKELLKSLAGYPRSARKLAGVLVADGAPFRSGGMEAGEKRPGLRWALSRCRCDEREVSVPHGWSGRCDCSPPRGYRDTAKRALPLGGDEIGVGR